MLLLLYIEIGYILYNFIIIFKQQYIYYTYVYINKQLENIH